MKVVHVVRQFHPSVGGMEEVVLNVAKRHAALGDADVSVVTLDRVFTDPTARLDRDDVYEGIPIRRIGYRGSSRYPLAPSVLSEIRDADIVHVHGIDFFYDFLALNRPFHGKPMVVSTHGGFFHTEYASRLKKLWFHTLTRASALGYTKIIATSENDGDMFSHVVAPSRLRVIENGVDVDKYARCGNPEPGRTLIYFGRWSVNKGLMETLDLLQALRASDDRWNLVLAGREYDHSRDDVMRAIAKRQLQGAVQVQVAPSQQQLRELMGQAQFFVCLSRHEGFGLAAVEAMSAGLLPILSDIPPFARLHRESREGVLVHTGDVAASAGRVQALAQANDQDHGRGRQAVMAYAGRYDWRHVVGQYLEEYRSALGIAQSQEVVR